MKKMNANTVKSSVAIEIEVAKQILESGSSVEELCNRACLDDPKHPRIDPNSIKPLLKLLQFALRSAGKLAD
jgi:hypothetical protein